MSRGLGRSPGQAGQGEGAGRGRRAPSGARGFGAGVVQSIPEMLIPARAGSWRADVLARTPPEGLAGLAGQVVGGVGLSGASLLGGSVGIGFMASAMGEQVSRDTRRALIPRTDMTERQKDFAAIGAGVTEMLSEAAGGALIRK